MLAEARRRELLGAMGIDVFLPRASATTAAAVPALIVACAAPGEATRPRDRLREALPHALGIDAARIHWMTVDASAGLPSAPAYLVLGAALRRSLDAQLSTMQQNGALVATADEPAASLRNAVAKRAIWQALKPLARRLRRGDG